MDTRSIMEKFEGAQGSVVDFWASLSSGQRNGLLIGGVAATALIAGLLLGRRSSTPVANTQVSQNDQPPASGGPGAAVTSAVASTATTAATTTSVPTPSTATASTNSMMDTSTTGVGESSDASSVMDGTILSEVPLPVNITMPSELSGDIDNLTPRNQARKILWEYLTPNRFKLIDELIDKRDSLTQGDKHIVYINKLICMLIYNYDQKSQATIDGIKKNTDNRISIRVTNASCKAVIYSDFEKGQVHHRFKETTDQLNEHANGVLLRLRSATDNTAHGELTEQQKISGKIQILKMFASLYTNKGTSRPKDRKITERADAYLGIDDASKKKFDDKIAKLNAELNQTVAATTTTTTTTVSSSGKPSGPGNRS